MASNKERSILIVGAGVFGLSTALHLLQRGWKNVTIIDRSPVLPAPDAASTDINKIVRSSYDDPVYTKLATEAIASWKNRNEWADAYHESGVILRGGKESYANLALQNDVKVGASVTALHSGDDLLVNFPKQIPLGPSLSRDFQGYINYDGGWANAEQGVMLALEKVRHLGGRVEPGRAAIGLFSDGHGVILEDRTVIRADATIIACGSWIGSSFPEMDMKERAIATGQSVASIQLSKDEAERYAKVPVVLDYTSGFYVFPPNASNVMKFAMHSVGYINPQGEGGISTPRTHITHPDGRTIPLEMAHTLRDILMSFYPELGTRPFASTRLCWYCETPDADWLIDFHPEYPSVLLATGGSGHAYKFLPILGRLVADRLENKLDPILANKFSFGRVFDNKTDRSRQMRSPKKLDDTPLWTDTDSAAFDNEAL